MKLSDFDYNLPKELIAQKPVKPRDHSRLLVLNRQTGKVEHKHFYNIIDYLQKGDVLVLNNTKVFPARLVGKRQGTGGKIEVFLLKRSKTQDRRPKSGEVWQVLIGNRRKRIGQIIEFDRGLKCEIIKQLDESVWLVKFNKSGRQFERIIDKIGQVPVPPYIKTEDRRYPSTSLKTGKTKKLKDDYQTVYAEHRGSVAAPTAGFHFTRSLINKLKRKGVQFEFITLHVGFGTFEPVKVEDITKHKMHVEFAILDNQTAARLNRAKLAGKRIIAVGTTVCRVLETFSNQRGIIKASKRWINLFIYPPFHFQFIDALITNFHLPKSTLLMLVSAFAPSSAVELLRRRTKASADRSAFASSRFILKTYQVAIKKKYRFYSFGDAMFIKYLDPA